jgi:phosphatidylglycerophosphate synthase
VAQTLQWQAVVRVPREPVLLAGLPAPLRAVQELSSLSDGARVERIFLSEVPEGSRAGWAPALSRLGVREVASSRLPAELSPGFATLLISGGGIPVASDLLRFWRNAAPVEAAVGSWRGQPVCVYLPPGEKVAPGWSAADAPLELAASGGRPRHVEIPDSAWHSLGDAAGIRDAERRVFASIVKHTDGYLSRFDRRISMALSRLLVRTRVTPNAITWVSILVGLVGAALVASKSAAVALAGTGLVWVSAILDGCDGEVARLKLLSSKWGARLDLFGDHVVNFSVLAAAALHVLRKHPGSEFWGLLAGLLAFGVLLSSVAAGRFLLRASEQDRNRAELILERLASRDFIYPLMALAAVGHIDWFLLSTAAGANAFWITFAVLNLRRGSTPEPV